MIGGKKIQKKLECISAEIDRLNKKAEELIRNSFYTCPHCSGRTKLRNISLIKQHQFNQSYNSYEDSTWDFSYYAIYCSKCFDLYGVDDSINGFYFIQANESLFKVVIDVDGATKKQMLEKIQDYE